MVSSKSVCSYKATQLIDKNMEAKYYFIPNPRILGALALWLQNRNLYSKFKRSARFWSLWSGRDWFSGGQFKDGKTSVMKNVSQRE